MVAGALAAELFPGARITFDPGLLHRLPELPAAGLVSIEPRGVELLGGGRALIELELTLTVETLDGEGAVWELTARCAALWRRIQRAADEGLPYAYTHGGTEISGHTGQEWLLLEGLEARYRRTPSAAPPRPAQHHATLGLTLAVVAPH